MHLRIERLPRKRGAPVRFIATFTTSFGAKDHMIMTTLPHASRNDAARDSNHLLRAYLDQCERERDLAEARAERIHECSGDWLPHPSESMFAWENGGPGLAGYDWPEETAGQLTLRNVTEGRAEVIRDGQLLGTVEQRAGGIWQPVISTGLNVRGVGRTMDEAAALLLAAYDAG